MTPARPAAADGPRVPEIFYGDSTKVLESDLAKSLEMIRGIVIGYDEDHDLVVKTSKGLALDERVAIAELLEQQAAALRSVGGWRTSLFAYSFTGLTSEIFADARRRQVPVQTPGPQPGEVWVLIDRLWRVAPRAATPLLIGVTDLADAERIATSLGGSLRELTRDQVDDAELLLYRASYEGGGRCR